MTGRARGGKNGAEPRTRIRLREVQVQDRICRGETQHDIAAALDISQPAVSKILKRVEERLLHDATWRVERQRARQSARLEFLYRQAIRAWEGSQEESLRRRQRKTGHGSGSEATVAEVISEARHGDPRFLEEARRVLEDLRKIWAIDAPDRLTVDTRSPYAVLSETALRVEIARQAQLLGQLAEPPAVTNTQEST